MKRNDRIKFNITRNWNFPGKERLSSLLNSSYKKRASRGGIAWLTNEDIAIFCNADNYIEWSVLSNGTYEDEISKLIRISLKPGDSALDIGGNIGLQSIRMSRCVGNSGKVFAFEPLNYLQEKFNKNIRLNQADNVTLLPFALSDVEGKAEFAINPGIWNQGTFSLLNSDAGPEKQIVEIKVADQLAELSSLQSLALVKIDVEGFEHQVLRGMKSLLLTHKPRLIFEYDADYWIKTGQDIQNCYAFLTGLGYSLYQVDKFGCDHINSPQQIQGGNLFCIPE
ncbi:FkbM family methyltransferase [Mucilaginibacter sp. dw_454]|uniref:FkbM family methyltransferase n=1 Tax=Mucilaginibacter sp. dw_454 TaxID=2720079 RepID=UPI001BD63D64|nr:FkbM family methyltransferase [Mucilaginibacter sp. dw_454]